MINNNTKIKICEKLGALQFQKLVFLVEKIKYVIIDKFFPNLGEWYNKQCDKKVNYLLKKVKTEEERKNIINYYRSEKLKFKKELNTKENRNYHINFNNPNEFINYLNFNKNIHVKGLKSNFICSAIIILLSIIFSNPYPILLSILLSYQGISAIINFECINLQNYNLYRLEDKRMKKIIRRVEEKNIKDINENMIEGIKVINKTLNETTEIPSIDDVINQITTKQEAIQLLYFAKKQLNVLNNNQKNKTKVKKGSV